MGRKRRLNRFITKWIKSDLPDDRSPVLLLGVTRIPTTPTAARRPCSLPLNVTTPSSDPIPNQQKFRKNSLSSRKSGIVRRNSSSSRRNRNCGGPGSSKLNNADKYVENLTVTCTTSVLFDGGDTNTCSTESDKRCSVTDGTDDLTPSNNLNSSDTTHGPMMDRSVDSIGACSLDVEASVELSDWSEQTSVGTLRSVSLPTPEPLPHLPSYLSLACTVSGYSTTTNYDPDRLARSRDASPHRIYDDLTSGVSQNRNIPTYSVCNNLLSPPNVVPLPHHKFTSRFSPGSSRSKTMEEQILTRREFYSSTTKTTTFMSKESKNFVSTIFSNDTVDNCMENGLVNEMQSKCVSFETRANYISNGTGKTKLESSYKEFLNGIENKSFIQQRVERLYGPGALAQGFFISKRQRNRLSGSDSETNTSKDTEKHSKSMIDKVLENDLIENNMKQSTSSPTLPVLRHLRPEFRAQLPIISPKKGTDSVITKSITVPVLTEEIKSNGHSKCVLPKEDTQINGSKNVITKLDNVHETGIKDGHYFLNILEKETKRLLSLADDVENELENEHLSEEIKGKLRAASGKARLLTSQKMQQFKGLCTNNITQREGEAYPTTNEDLQGFWDMVLLQVEQIDELFRELDALRKNGWKEIKPEIINNKNGNANGTTSKPRKLVNRTKPLSTVSEDNRKQREAQRKQMIEARRKAMKEQAQKQGDTIEIYVPGSS